MKLVPVQKLVIQQENIMKVLAAMTKQYKETMPINITAATLNLYDIRQLLQCRGSSEDLFWQK